jgi:hypothetical protein
MYRYLMKEAGKESLRETSSESRIHLIKEGLGSSLFRKGGGVSV